MTASARITRPCNSRVEYPILDAAVRVVCGLSCSGPEGLNLADEAVLVLLGAFLDLSTLGREKAVELTQIPRAVWFHNFAVPVLLDQVLQVLAVRGSREGHVVV